MIAFLAVALLAFDPLADAVKLTIHHRGGAAQAANAPPPKWIGKSEGLKLSLFAADAPDKVVATFEMSPRRKDTRVTHWDFSPDGRRVAIGAGDPRGKQAGDSAGEVKVFDLATGKLLARISDGTADVGYVSAVQFSADGSEVHIYCAQISGK